MRFQARGIPLPPIVVYTDAAYEPGNPIPAAAGIRIRDWGVHLRPIGPRATPVVGVAIGSHP